MTDAGLLGGDGSWKVFCRQGDGTIDGLAFPEYTWRPVASLYTLLAV